MSLDLDNVYSRISMDHDCWKWNGVHFGGYAKVHVAKTKRYVSVHRVVYEDTNGPIPAHLEIDHLCRNTGCVNPLHLEAVTHHENMLRGIPGKHLADRTHCPKGHAYDNANTRIGTNGRHRRRSCRTCMRDLMRQKRAAKPKLPRKPIALATHCAHGHEYTAETTYRWTNPKTGKSHRQCLICNRSRNRTKKPFSAARST
jgi:hypothetical protein